jgi:hypothetical protein
MNYMLQIRNILYSEFDVLPSTDLDTELVEVCEFPKTACFIVRFVRFVRFDKLSVQTTLHKLTIIRIYYTLL